MGKCCYAACILIEYTTIISACRDPASVQKCVCLILGSHQVPVIRSLPINQCSGPAAVSPADASRVWGLEPRTCGLREARPKCEQDIWRKLSMDYGFLFSHCIPRSHQGDYYKDGDMGQQLSPRAVSHREIQAFEWVTE